MKTNLTTLFLFIIVHCLQAQCSGNLGENIFTEGDFGSGVANIPAQDPMIAPGYSYTVVPPPNDGSYVITNNTTSWRSFASFWADIGDNSPDPNGYMMVVNASFSPGLFYEKEVTEAVYEAENFPPNSASDGWTGQRDGRDAEPGIYVYLAKVAFLDGRVLEYSGEVNLLR